MLADPAMLRPHTPDAAPDDPLLLYAARRGAAVPTPPAPQGDGAHAWKAGACAASAQAAGRACLLDYAAFVLDQEARYCQL